MAKVVSGDGQDCVADFCALLALKGKPHRAMEKMAIPTRTPRKLAMLNPPDEEMLQWSVQITVSFSLEGCSGKIFNGAQLVSV